MNVSSSKKHVLSSWCPSKIIGHLNDAQNTRKWITSLHDQILTIISSILCQFSWNKVACGCTHTQQRCPCYVLGLYSSQILPKKIIYLLRSPIWCAQRATSVKYQSKQIFKKILAPTRGMKERPWTHAQQ